MDCLLLLLLMALSKVQGYHSDTNDTLSDNHIYRDVLSGSRQQKQFDRNNFDEVFDHYRSEGRNREPRFVSFQTKDDHIEVEIDFAIPFLSIPVKRSLSGAMGTFQNVIKVCLSCEKLRLNI